MTASSDCAGPSIHSLASENSKLPEQLLLLKFQMTALVNVDHDGALLSVKRCVLGSDATNAAPARTSPVKQANGPERFGRTRAWP